MVTDYDLLASFIIVLQLHVIVCCLVVVICGFRLLDALLYVEFSVVLRLFVLCVVVCWCPWVHFGRVILGVFSLGFTLECLLVADSCL